MITGGDPFLNRKNMEAAIDGLKEVDHVQTLRLATRSIAYYPDLFLEKEAEYLKYVKQKSLELNRLGKRMEVATHFIHPDEVSSGKPGHHLRPGEKRHCRVCPDAFFKRLQ